MIYPKPNLDRYSTVKMQYLIVFTLIIIGAGVITEGQFFGFGRPHAHFFRQPAQLAQPAFANLGNCVPHPNYQTHRRNFWISWRGGEIKYLYTYVSASVTTGWFMQLIKCP